MCIDLFGVTSLNLTNPIKTIYLLSKDRSVQKPPYYCTRKLFGRKKKQKNNKYKKNTRKTQSLGDKSKWTREQITKGAGNISDNRIELSALEKNSDNS